MGTKNWTRHIAWGVLGLVSQQAFAQATQDNNNGGLGSFLGWNAGANQILEVRNDANQPIEWYTDAIRRMQLNRTQNVTINGFTVPTDGFLGLGRTPVGNTAPGNPWTRLHLHDADAGAGVITAGFRDWMRNGITFTGHGDHMYVGHKYRSGAQDPTDAIVHWADNSGTQLGPDLLRFIFTSSYSAAAVSGQNSLFGREIMQLHPQGFIGMGDWNAASVAAGSAVEPNERLDLLDQTLRLRDFADPALYRRDNLTRVLVADAADGRVYWKPESAISTVSGNDCKWTLLGAGNASIATAYAGNPGCPQYDRFVGIGTNAPSAKLHVMWTGTTGNAEASRFLIDGTSYSKRAGDFTSTGSGSLHGGIRATARGATSSMNAEGNFGVHGRAEATASVGRNRGLFSEALVPTGPVTVGANIGLEIVSTCSASNTVTSNYGLIASTSNAAITTNDYAGRFIASATNAAAVFGIDAAATGSGTATAYGIRAHGTSGASSTVYGIRATASAGANSVVWSGWFGGDIWVQNTGYFTNGSATISDQNLKTGIEDLSGALARINQLQPKTYAFNTGAYPMMELSEEPQIGLLAQEVEAVLPEAVSSTVFPAQFDSLGNQTSEGFPVKAINYDKITPVLIGAINEQQAIIHAMQQELASMQAQLAACCTQPSTDQRLAPAAGLTDNEQLAKGEARLLRIAPNPFIDRTTLHYTLERSGRMQLLVNSADGRDLRVLSEAQREAGEFQYEWSTANLAPGVYYITLLLDGEPLVKRAVKMGQ
jgi:hypothetical protein